MEGREREERERDGGRERECMFMHHLGPHHLPVSSLVDRKDS